jgi:hypothetical protein
MGWVVFFFGFPKPNCREVIAVGVFVFTCVTTQGPASITVQATLRPSIKDTGHTDLFSDNSVHRLSNFMMYDLISAVSLSLSGESQRPTLFAAKSPLLTNRQIRPRRLLRRNTAQRLDDKELTST